jgi:hypothetical protein
MIARRINPQNMVKPGLQVRVSMLSLSVGYGIKGSTSAYSLTSGLQEGFSAGLALIPAHGLKLEAYYTQIDKIVGVLSFMF